jgi:hypothetical protein
LKVCDKRKKTDWNKLEPYYVETVVLFVINAAPHPDLLKIVHRKKDA